MYSKEIAVQILGNSGTGKTSLFDIIIGLREPNSGKVKINNYEIPTYMLIFFVFLKKIVC